jgi:hypothetical protein
MVSACLVVRSIPIYALSWGFTQILDTALKEIYRITGQGQHFIAWPMQQATPALTAALLGRMIAPLPGDFVVMIDRQELPDTRATA